MNKEILDQLDLLLFYMQFQSGPYATMRNSAQTREQALSDIISLLTRD